MPATVTLKECKRQVSRLPRKQRTALAESILQEEYERECLEKAEQCFKDIEAGKVTVRPYEDVMRDLRNYAKSLTSAKAASKR